MCLGCGTQSASAQRFMTKGRIVFEKKINYKAWKAELMERMPDNANIELKSDYGISYFDLIFSADSSLYKYSGSHQADASGIDMSKSAVFVNKDSGTYIASKFVFTDYYFIKDSLPDINWRLSGETRKIAGFDCRKAVGIIQDSVYVVAFYCLEMLPQSGPELFHGLPGMILGIAIPQRHTTWFATQVYGDVETFSIAAPLAKKKDHQYSVSELKEVFLSKTKGMPEEGVRYMKKLLMETLDSCTL